MNKASKFKNLASIIASVCIFGVCVSYFLALVSVDMEQKGFSSTQIGISHSVNFLSIFVLGRFIPRIIVKIGNRNSFILSVAIFIISSNLHYLATPHYYLMLLCRVFTGASVASIFVISESWINSNVSSNNRAKVAGIYISILLLMFSLGSYMLGVIPLYGYSSYLAVTAYALISLLPLIFASKQNKNKAEENHEHFKLFRTIKMVPMVAIVGAAFGFAEITLLSLMPLYALGIGYNIETAAKMLTIFLVGGSAAQFAIGYFADKYSKQSLLMINLLICFLSCFAIEKMLSDNQVGYAEWALLFIWGSFMLTIYTLLMAYIGENYSGKKLIDCTLLLVMMYNLGSSAGPFTVGVLMDVIGGVGMTYSIAAVFALSLGSLLVLKSKGSRNA